MLHKIPEHLAVLGVQGMRQSLGEVEGNQGHTVLFQIPGAVDVLVVQRAGYQPVGPETAEWIGLKVEGLDGRHLVDAEHLVDKALQSIQNLS